MSKSKKSGDGWKIFGILILIIIVMLGIAGLVLYAISSNEEEEIDEIIEDEDIEDPSYHVHHWQLMNDSVSHWNYCSLCNQIDSDSFESHNFSDVMVVYPYNYSDGYSQYTCDVCGYSFIDIIPWDDKYLPDEETPDEEEPDYVDPEDCTHSYVYVFDDNSHWYQCELCGEELDGSEQVHSLSLLSDSSGHYYYCDVCDYESSVTSHFLTSGYDDINHYSECKTCGYQTNVEAHSKTSVTSNGSTGHIYKCSCGYSYGEEDHFYSSQWFSDSYDCHYVNCSDCSYSRFHSGNHLVLEHPKTGVCTSSFSSKCATYYIYDVRFSPFNNTTYRIDVPCHDSSCNYTLSIDTLVSYEVANGFVNFLADFYNLASQGKGAMKTYYTNGYYEVGPAECIFEYYDLFLNNYLDDYC